jgi:alkaline phosphatase
MASARSPPGRALAGSGAADRTREVRKAVQDGRARNVLLFIGDGMGDSEITIARNYAVGADGRLTMDRLPPDRRLHHLRTAGGRPLPARLRDDSAASGTSWATGHKTSNGRISTTAGTDTDLPTILELAKGRTAWPAALRTRSRPAAPARSTYSRSTTTSTCSWAAADSGSSSPSTAAQPSLADMTTKAISLLEAKAKGRRHGFFLQVEGASIDKQDHAENPCGQIGETVAFDRAIAVGLAFAKRHPDTLVVVTADGANMVVSYATNLDGRSQSHTGTQVRIAAQGPQAANVVGVTDQTHLFSTMARALGLSS